MEAFSPLYRCVDTSLAVCLPYPYSLRHCVLSRHAHIPCVRYQAVMLTVYGGF